MTDDINGSYDDDTVDPGFSFSGSDETDAAGYGTASSLDFVDADGDNIDDRSPSWVGTDPAATAAEAPVWEAAPADDINAAIAYADHLVDQPYDHPALDVLTTTQGAVDQIAGPEAVAGVLGQPYTEGETLDDVMWQQLGLTGYEDLQGFIDTQYAMTDQLAAVYDPGLAPPVPGYEQFFGPLGLQTASGVPLPTLSDISWTGASTPDISTVLGPYQGLV